MSDDRKQNDLDPEETLEWLESLDSVIEYEGFDRAKYLLTRLAQRASEQGSDLPYKLTTPYRNTIPKHLEAPHPGDLFMERRIRSYIRWNALAMVMRANKDSSELGGHISSFASSATLYDVGFNHFFRASNDQQEGDLVYVQGHVAPGIYARAFLEGRLTAEQLDNYRQEVDGKGVSSYPHPKLMPDFWQFPTVSMGLGPIQAIYQARFLKYLQHRGLEQQNDRKVWAFLGDGECDEPEALGAISLASRENLDNLIFVINCNLQRLDGPVRGNGKIVQELEGVFRGAGWNVIKVIWGRHWDPLFEKDHNGVMQKGMDEAVDGEYQNFKYRGGAYTREHFFGTDPELLRIASDLSDTDIANLNRGGHDPYKVYAAYHEAVNTKGQPTVILAKTVKGYSFGPAAEANNVTHSVKKLDMDALLNLRERYGLPLTEEQVANLEYIKPDDNTPEMRYMHERRRTLGGYLPSRRAHTTLLDVPGLDKFKSQLASTGERESSNTMGFVRILSTLGRDKSIGKHIVPIICDEARTFGMEGMFKQMGIYTAEGQKYEPMDSDQVMFYKESLDGQILQEGINEAGSQASWNAAATSYSVSNIPMIPFYIFYSMFGLQRVMDLIWAAGDMQARGFLIGGTSGRTTLNGEGLQHEDGHSHVLASTIPNCISYDPTYNYELAVIIQNGIERMYRNDENVFYYITTLNENFAHPAMPEGVEEGILKGMYQLHKSSSDAPLKAQLLGSGAILREVEAAAEILEKDYGVACDIWSCTSFNELRREAMDVERWNMLHPEQDARKAYVTECLEQGGDVVVASTDYIKTYADQIRQWVPGHYNVLGTDGFGRSDYRAALRRHFEVNRYYVVVATLAAFAQRGDIKASVVTDAMKAFNIDPDKPNPLYA
jgi:pyruvate dehydrogenase E1 component